VEGTEQPPHGDYVYALREEEAYLQGDEEKPPVPGEPFDDASIVCQFCGRSWKQVRGVFEAKRRVRDPNTSALTAVWICNQCVARMAQTLAEEPAGTPWLLGWEVWSQRGAARP
jgi:fructose-1,6-bisphosphatase/inositol monophosphatase family enzyme